MRGRLAATGLALGGLLAGTAILAPPAFADAGDVTVTVFGDPSTAITTNTSVFGTSLGLDHSVGFTRARVQVYAYVDDSTPSGFNCAVITVNGDNGDPDEQGTYDFAGSDIESKCGEAPSWITVNVILPACLASGGTYFAAGSQLSTRTWNGLEYPVYQGVTTGTPAQFPGVTTGNVEIGINVPASAPCAPAPQIIPGCTALGSEVSVNSQYYVSDVVADNPYRILSTAATATNRDRGSNGGALWYDAGPVGGGTGFKREQVKPSTPGRTRYYRWSAEVGDLLSNDLTTIPVTGGFYNPQDGDIVTYRQRFVNWMGFGGMSSLVPTTIQTSCS